MRPSRFLSSTSLLLLAGCPSNGAPAVCGATIGADQTIEVADVADDARAVEFGLFTVDQGGDCPAPSPPGGLISVTIFASQVAPEGQAVLTFCLPRPDLLEGDEAGVTVPLLPDTQPAGSGDRAHLIDVQGALEDGCRWQNGPGLAVSGTVTFRGLCDDAVGEPWDLEVDATAEVVETCGADPEQTIEVALSGGVRVAPL